MHFNISIGALRVAKAYFPDLETVENGELWSVKLPCEVTHIPLFDAQLVQNELSETIGINTDLKSLFIHWLDAGRKRKLAPTRLFDESQYLEQYPDVKEAQMWAFEHFVLHGAKEGRSPNSSIPDCAPSHIVEEKYRNALLSTKDIEFLKSIIGFFQNEELKAAIRASNPESIINLLSQDENFSLLFNPSVYRKALLSEYPELHIPEGRELLHWVRNGRNLPVRFTPFFSLNYYREKNRDLSNLSDERLLQHYFNHGIHENRNGSSLFNADRYAAVNKLPHKTSSVLSALKGLRVESKGIATQAIYIDSETKLELLADLEQKNEALSERLLAPEIQEQLKKVEAYEPRVNFKGKGRSILQPMLNHPANDLYSADMAIFKSLPKTRYKAIMLIPHCRMSGAARVSGALAHVLAKQFGSENLCIVTTDGTTFEHPEWFPTDVTIFNFHEHTLHLASDAKIQALILLLRGVDTKFIYNVNSRLCWETLHAYGKQLKTLFSITSYLFCSDRTKSGLRTGYPQEFFTQTFPIHDWVFVDNQKLKDEIVQDHHLTGKYADKILVLRTPIHEKIGVATIRSQEGLKIRNRKRRVFWAGRFDRQKNFNLLLKIAQGMPDVEFWVWGKAVLDTPDQNLDEPRNIKPMGEYGDFSELPLEVCDVWLYTSLWDGMPTIMLDVASAGIPVVASAAGAIPELLSEFPEFLVPEQDIDEPAPYIEKIRYLLDHNEFAFGKAEELQGKAMAAYEQEIFSQAVVDTLSAGA
ncbi:glycosyltransferase [Microbulbifer sp. ALW1]|uniref:glycosyltransferase n=1 Tax=Microbulbifer sp. (strain ALW1) TaxID=1516059 RepID=UPI00135BAB4C|nr:glycosyltransferase [Microbulbifer sp. ALW1]